ncbi:MAG: hypothetical protein K0S74_598 [Chlamydiales bacterium]|jgi:hypothetical protein|nr:hypothetical protein [Chlamydiales bacterium]
MYSNTGQRLSANPIEKNIFLDVNKSNRMPLHSCFNLGQSPDKGLLTKLGEQRLAEVLNTPINITPKTYARSYYNNERILSYRYIISAYQLIEGLYQEFTDMISHTKLVGSAAGFVLHEGEVSDNFRDVDIEIYLTHSLSLPEQESLFLKVSNLLERLDPTNNLRYSQMENVGGYYIQKFSKFPEWCLITVGTISENCKSMDMKFIFKPIHNHVAEAESGYAILDNIFKSSNFHWNKDNLSIVVGSHSGDLLHTYKQLKGKIFSTNQPEKVIRGGWERWIDRTTFRGFIAPGQELYSFQGSFLKNIKIDSILNDSLDDTTQSKLIPEIAYSAIQQLLTFMINHNLNCVADDQGFYWFQNWKEMRFLSLNSYSKFFSKELTKEPIDLDRQLEKLNSVISKIQEYLSKEFVTLNYSEPFLNAMKLGVKQVPRKFLKNFLKICTLVLPIEDPNYPIVHNGKPQFKIEFKTTTEKIRTLFLPCFSASSLEKLIAEASTFDSRSTVWDSLEEIYRYVLSRQVSAVKNDRESINISLKQLLKIKELPWRYSTHLACWLAFHSQIMKKCGQLNAFIATLIPSAWKVCETDMQRKNLLDAFAKATGLPKKTIQILKGCLEKKGEGHASQAFLDIQLKIHKDLDPKFALFLYHYINYGQQNQTLAIETTARANLYIQFPRLLQLCSLQEERKELLTAYVTCFKIPKKFIDTWKIYIYNDQIDVAGIARSLISFYLEQNNTQKVNIDFLDALIVHASAYYELDINFQSEWPLLKLQTILQEKGWDAAANFFDTINFAVLSMGQMSSSTQDFLMRFYLERVKRLPEGALTYEQASFFMEMILQVSQGEKNEKRYKLLKTPLINTVIKDFIHTTPFIDDLKWSIKIAHQVLSPEYPFQTGSLYLQLIHKLLELPSYTFLILPLLPKLFREQGTDKILIERLQELLKGSRLSHLFKDMYDKQDYFKDLNLLKIFEILIIHSVTHELYKEYIIDLWNFIEVENLWDSTYTRAAVHIGISSKVLPFNPILFANNQFKISLLNLGNSKLDHKAKLQLLKYAIDQYENFNIKDSNFSGDICFENCIDLLTLEWPKEEFEFALKQQWLQSLYKLAFTIFNVKQAKTILNTIEQKGYFAELYELRAQFYNSLLEKWLKGEPSLADNIQFNVAETRQLLQKAYADSLQKYFDAAFLAQLGFKIGSILTKSSLFKELFEFLCTSTRWKMWQGHQALHDNLVKGLVIGITLKQQNLEILGDIIRTKSLNLEPSIKAFCACFAIQEALRSDSIEEAFKLFYCTHMALQNCKSYENQIQNVIKDLINAIFRQTPGQRNPVAVIENRWKIIQKYLRITEQLSKDEIVIVGNFIDLCIEHTDPTVIELGWHQLYFYLNKFDLDSHSANYQAKAISLLKKLVNKGQLKALSDIYQSVCDVQERDISIIDKIGKDSYLILLRYAFKHYLSVEKDKKVKPIEWNKNVETIVIFLSKYEIQTYEESSKDFTAASLSIVECLYKSNRIEYLDLAYQLLTEQSKFLIKNRIGYTTHLVNFICQYIRALKCEQTCFNKVHNLLSMGLGLGLLGYHEKRAQEALEQVLLQLVNSQQESLILYAIGLFTAQLEEDNLIVKDPLWCELVEKVIYQLAQLDSKLGNEQIFKFFSTILKIEKDELHVKLLTAVAATLSSLRAFIVREEDRGASIQLFNLLESRKEWQVEKIIRANFYKDMINKYLLVAKKLAPKFSLQAALFLTGGLARNALDKTYEGIEQLFVNTIKSLNKPDLAECIEKGIELFNHFCHLGLHITASRECKLSLLDAIGNLRLCVDGLEEVTTNPHFLIQIKQFWLSTTKLYKEILDNHLPLSGTVKKEMLEFFAFALSVSIEKMPDLLNKHITTIKGNQNTLSEVAILADCEMLDTIFACFNECQNNIFSEFHSIRLKCYKTLFLALTQSWLDQAEEIISYNQIMSYDSVNRTSSIEIRSLSYDSQATLSLLKRRIKIGVIEHYLTLFLKLIDQENWNEPSRQVQKEAFEFYRSCLKS